MDGVVRAWAREEFAGLELGDVRRNERLLAMVSRIGERPAGTVTGVFRSEAEREGAFRLLESTRVEERVLGEAQARAALERCRPRTTVFVPVDATGLTFADTHGRKGLGPIGTRHQGARGLQAMTALVVDDSGTTLGICAQRYWRRSEKASPKYQDDRRAPRARESAEWMRTLRTAHERFTEHAPETKPWYQLDRGADYWQVLSEGVQLGLLLTIRAAYDRKVDASTRKLWQTLRARRVSGTMSVQVPSRPGHAARLATLSIRAAHVPLLLQPRGAAQRRVCINAVLVTEQGSVPPSERIEWMLLTTADVTTFDDAVTVVRGYTMRWRVEEFHRAWKSGGCNVEASQLRSRKALVKWATLLASVAARIERLKRLAREQPDLPATEELSRDEIDAVIALGELKGRKAGDTPTLGQVVQAIARLGGYTGKSSGGPPGATVLARGLADVAVAAKVLRLQREK
jgi:hypothetical protein